MKKLILCLLFVAGCETVPPTPFPEGHPTIPPPGCETLRERGGEC